MLDLNGQFSCRGENKSDGTISRAKERLTKTKREVTLTENDVE